MNKDSIQRAFLFFLMTFIGFEGKPGPEKPHLAHSSLEFVTFIPPFVTLFFLLAGNFLLSTYYFCGLTFNSYYYDTSLT